MFHPHPGYRRTVAGLVIRPATVTNPYPAVLLQWPAKAAQAEEGNLTTIQGGFDSHDSDLQSAMEREVREECGIEYATIYPISHRQYRSSDTMKEYVWFLVVCPDPVTLSPNQAEVARADWYHCPQMLTLGVKQMHPFKGRMYREVFEAACLQYPALFGAYVPYVARHRKKRRQFQERRELQQLVS